MSNRVIKDSIWDSPTLDPMPDYFEDQFPRWLLLADDWGCFNANPERIKGMVYPNRKKETANKIKEIMTTFNEYGLLFLWEDEGRQWGHFVSNDKHHNFCNASQVDLDGKRVKHRRKTPEPPKDLLNSYLQKFGTNWDKLGQLGTKSPNPNPNPNPNPKHKPVKTENIILDYFNEKAGKNYRPTETNLEGIKARLDEKYTEEDCMKVIDGRIKAWSNDSEMLEYLTPQTLFRKSKFPKYLNNSQPVQTAHEARIAEIFKNAEEENGG